MVMPCVNHSWSEHNAATITGDFQLANIETEVVEPANPLIDKPRLLNTNRFFPRQLLPQVLITLNNAPTHRNYVQLRIEESAGLQIHELSDDVGMGNVNIVKPAGI